MICIIPARGGSKRIPRKNIREFYGKPIISYPISIAINAGYDVIVSTEDSEIAEIAESYGADIHFRADYLAEDKVELEDVLYDVLNYEDDIACMMLPTAVFIKPEDLATAEKMLGKYDVVYSITRFEYPPQRALVNSNGCIRMVSPEHRNSQDIQALYHDAAQFYTFNVWPFLDGWEQGLRLLELPAYGIEYLPSEVQDIDTPEDWIIAEMKYKARGL